MMKRIQNVPICLMLCGATMLLPGCGEPAPTVAVPANSTNKPVTATPVPALASTPQVTAAAPAAEPTTDLAALTQVLRRYSMERQQVPQSLADVVAAGYLKSLPAAPPGKKFAINAKRVEVMLVNQ